MQFNYWEQIEQLEDLVSETGSPSELADFAKDIEKKLSSPIEADVGEENDVESQSGIESEFERDFEIGENREFQPEEEQQYLASFEQLKGLGQYTGGVTGLFGKTEKISEAMGTSKEKLFLIKLASALDQYFDANLINIFVENIQSIPRFWLKNVDALAVTIDIWNKGKNTKITTNLLDTYSKSTGLDAVDLYRYYLIIKKYWG
jgi:hypothetical protein